LAIEEERYLTPTAWTPPTDADRQWAYHSSPTAGALYRADISLLDAWQQGATGSEVIVAVLDTGADLEHPALTDQLWRNTGEIADNGFDDDANGLIDDVHGASLAGGNGDVTDATGHGTAVAGLIAGAPLGATPIGVAPQAAIMTVKISDDTGHLTVENAASGIVYAVEHGAHILCTAWTLGPAPSALLEDAIDVAEAQGVLVVAAAGNQGADLEQTAAFPASYTHGNVLTVGGSNRQDQPASFPGLWSSATGLTSVDVLSPAVGLVTLHPNETETSFSGTSAAAATVAGIAALVHSVSTTPGAVNTKNVLLDSVDPTNDATLSGGRLNAGSAVRLAISDQLPLEFSLTAPESFEPGESFDIDIDGPSDAVFLWHNQDKADPSEVSSTLIIDTPGLWTVTVAALSSSGAQGLRRFQTQAPVHWRPVVPLSIESGHGGDSEQGEMSLQLTASGAKWTRLHFGRIDLNTATSPPSYVALFDAWGLPVWSTDGSSESLVTPALPTGEYTLAWSLTAPSAGQASFWGFAVDGASFSRDAPAVAASPTCQGAPISRIGPLWLMVLTTALLAFRRASSNTGRS